MPENISSISLPPVYLNNIPNDATIETLMALIITLLFLALRQTLTKLSSKSMRKRSLALLVDLFGTLSFDIAKEFNIPDYIVCTSSVISLVSIFKLPILDNCILVSSGYDKPEPIRLPGCVSVQGVDIPKPLQDKKHETYKLMLLILEVFSLKGVLVNRFFDLELGAFKSIEEGE
nr:hydroquinone glucosyltransferase-like [Tanacetum cinerariifolium]